MSKYIVVIFLLAVSIRFLYFPENIYFGFDQARDAYESLDILKGDLKIIGPTTSFVGLNHGVLYYYILAPLYFLGNNSPEFVAAVWRIFNALGLFIIFYLAKILFDKKITAIVAVTLFAVSFEQTQFAIFLHHPSLGVLSTLIMYLGLTLVIFKHNKYGLPLAALGLGLSIQFEFPLIYLVVPFMALVGIFYKNFLRLPLKTFVISFVVFALSVASFILVEVKSNFRTVNSLIALSGFNPDKTISSIFNTYLYTATKMVDFNLTGNWIYAQAALIILFIIYIWFVLKKNHHKQLIFLGIWFVGILATFIINGGSDNLEKNVPLYYPSVGASISLLLLSAFFIERIYRKNIYLALILMGFVIFSNLSQITKLNPNGTILELTVQQGMLLSDEKKVIDFIYNNSNNQAFAVKAVTMPFHINSTWSYLFEWYGKNKYGYLPIWGGKNALGYPGNLPVENAQDKLPNTRYVIIEPTRGIRPGLIDDFLTEEGYFSKVVSEQKIGQFVVQKREKI